MYWWIFIGTRGGKMRADILKLLMDKPMNANQLAKELNVNYRTITHHLNFLLENGLVVAEGPRYGSIYSPSEAFISRHQLFEGIINGTIVKVRGGFK